MRKILIFGAALLIVLWLAKTKIGDLRPVVLPPAKISAPTTSPETLPIDVNDNNRVTIFADGVPGARDLQFSPGGTLLVSLTGSGKVVVLPAKIEILSGLDRPHGLAFYQGKLFVAEETRVVRYNWDEANLKASVDKILFSLPGGGNHFTRSIVFNKSGQMFVSIGSTCNVCLEKNPWYAAIITSNANGDSPRLFANGLRNSVFLITNPKTDEIWATDMGRDYLGDDLPPDEINIVKDNGDYGWPVCYGNKIHDTSFGKNNSCGNTISPLFAIPAHSAPLGLAFDESGDLLVAYHGSWNRSVPTGYKVVRLKVLGNTITSAQDFLTGFLQGGLAVGRPVDLVIKDNFLYVSDDKAGRIYRISYSR